MSIFKQCLAGKDRFLDQQIPRYLQRRTNMATINSTQLSWKEGDLPPSSSKRLTGMSLREKDQIIHSTSSQLVEPRVLEAMGLFKLRYVRLLNSCG